MEHTKNLVKELDLAFKLRKSGDFSTALEILNGLELQTDNPEDIAMLGLFQATCLTDMGLLAKSLNRISRVDKERLSKASQIDLEFEFSRIFCDYAIKHGQGITFTNESYCNDTV
jgi:hypothetical protein